MEIDNNAPLLQRSNTSIVRMRDANRIQEEQQLFNVVKANRQEICQQGFIVGFFTLCYFAPNILGGERDEECLLSAGWTSAMFAWTIMGPMLLSSVLFNLVYHCKARSPAPGELSEYVQKWVVIRVIFKSLLIFLGMTIYWIYCMTMWKDLKASHGCMQGYNMLDFVNWVFTLFMTTPVALITLCLCVCCCPCVTTMLCALGQQRREEGAAAEQQTKGILDGLLEQQFNPKEFSKQTECCICLSDFTADDDVTMLPCPGAHYFHQDCIKGWIEMQKTECPLCRGKIDPEGFAELNDKLKAGGDNSINV